jgi:glutamate dehydrogenase
MTTLSVREFVLSIQRKLNLNPTSLKKMQTGGPDGDLGSNEILLSNEKYTAIGESRNTSFFDLSKGMVSFG